MRSLLTRLLAGVFVCLTVAGCPAPVPAKPKPATAPAIWWYAPDWADPQAFDAPTLQAAGVTGVIAVAAGHQFDPQNRALSLDEVRGWAAPIKARAGSLSVCLSFSVVRQAGNPTPASPARTLCDPRDTAAKTQLLDNYATIGRVCRENGFVGLALDSEDFDGQGTPYPDEPGARDLGGALAKACRQNNSTLQLVAYGPLGQAPPGFQKVWRGFFDGAPDAIFYTEDTYGIGQVDVKKALQRCGAVTGTRHPAAGWWASTAGTDPAAAWQAAIPQLQAAARTTPTLFIYRAGQMTSDQQAALGRTLHALRSP